MANLNKVILMGNLTATPELRTTPGKGTSVTDISLAINRYFSGENGTRQEETTFVDITLWGRQAEIACQYLTKGRGVLVEGRLQLDSWEDRETHQKRSRLRVVGENLQLLGSARDAQGGGGAPSGDPRPSSPPRSGNAGSPPPRNTRPSSPVEEFDDDIPF